MLSVRQVRWFDFSLVNPAHTNVRTQTPFASTWPVLVSFLLRRFLHLRLCRLLLFLSLSLILGLGLGLSSILCRRLELLFCSSVLALPQVNS